MLSLATSLGTPRVASVTEVSLSELSQGGVLHVGESKAADRECTRPKMDGPSSSQSFLGRAKHGAYYPRA